MSVHSITLEGTSSVRLPVGGKYCDRDIVISTVGGPVLPALTTPGAAENLLAGKQMIDGEGNIVEGTMVNNGTWSRRVSRGTYDIPEGYHDGNGKIRTTAKTLTVTPTKEQQVLTDENYYYSTVTVEPISDQYQDVTPVTATAEDVAKGKVIVDATGAVVTGTAEASASSEYYIVTNKTALDLVIFDHVIKSGKTVKVPVDIAAINECGAYVVAYTWLNNIVTPTTSVITATGFGRTTQNRINKYSVYWGTVATAVFMTGLDISTSPTAMQAPASGSAIQLT